MKLRINLYIIIHPVRFHFVGSFLVGILVGILVGFLVVGILVGILVGMAIGKLILIDPILLIELVLY